jgi:uncharacterized protein YuzE
MSYRHSYYDRDADIVWLPTAESQHVVSEEVGWGLIDRDAGTNEIVALEIWEASRRLPDAILAALPAPGGQDREGRLEPPAAGEPARLEDGPYGPVLGATGTPVTDAQVRSTLEAVRERR